MQRLHLRFENVEGAVFHVQLAYGSLDLILSDDLAAYA
jgi:hypothetical protein